MRKIVLVIGLLCTFVQYAIANGYQTFHQAQIFFSQGKFSQAKSNFTLCLNDPAFADVKGNVNVWIIKCESAIQEQNRNAQIVAERRKRKLVERKNNRYVYISVNASETGEIYSSTVSAMSEVMRLNGRRFCPNIDDALTVVTVSLDINKEGVVNGFYKAKGNGVVRLGNAIDANDFVGQWSVDCEATSAVDANDARRLLLNKLNHRLGYALDNLLNGRPQESGYYIPEQSISIYFAQDCVFAKDGDFAKDGEPEKKLSFLRESLSGYITKTPGVTLSTALDETRNSERDEIAQIQAQYVKMESRAPVHELEGFSQILRISVKHGTNGYYTFVGELSELATGKSLTTVTINGADFGIADLTAKNQELAAKLLAVGLGFKEWVIGEDIGGYKLASFNGMHGLLLHIVDPNNTAKADIINLLNSPNAIGLDNLWRYPHTNELLQMFKHRQILGLATKFWSADSPAKKMSEVVDFSYSAEDTPTIYKDSKYAAAILLVKEF